jgi:hypothetical protein
MDYRDKMPSSNQLVGFCEMRINECVARIATIELDGKIANRLGNEKEYDRCKKAIIENEKLMDEWNKLKGEIVAEAEAIASPAA